MVRRFRALACIAAAGAAIGLSACDGPSDVAQPGPGEMALATQRLDQELNAAAEAIRRSLVAADSDKRIYPWELEIAGAVGGTQVDWWLYDHGYIRVGGVTGTQGYFVLTPKGEAFAKGPAPRWLVSSFQGKPQVTCAGSHTFASCRVSGVANVQAAPMAGDLLADSTAPAQTFEVVLQKGPDGWAATDFSDTSTPGPADAGRRALLGDAKAMAKAQNRYAIEVNRQVQ